MNGKHAQNEILDFLLSEKKFNTYNFLIALHQSLVHHTICSIQENWYRACLITDGQIIINKFQQSRV